MVQIIFFVLGVLSIAGGIALPTLGIQVNPVVQTMLVAFGFLLIVIGLVFSAYASFYRKGKPDESIVRVGGFTTKKKKETEDKPDVALRSGMWVIGMVHNVDTVSHKQYVLTVDRRGEQALICADSKLADVLATFKVSVGQKADDVLKFAAKAGAYKDEHGGSMNKQAIIEILIGDTIETALRDACTSKAYMEVFQDREAIAKAIEDSVDDDFKKMGLVLDSVKLKDVDMTPENYYKPKNPQHAVGLTAIVEINEDQRLATETKKLKTSELIKAQQVTTNKQILQLDQDDEFAKSAQQKSVSIQRASDQRAAEEATIEEEEAVEKRRIAKTEAVAVRTAAQERASQEAVIEQQEAVEIAEQQKQLALESERQAREEAEINRQKAVAVAEEKKQLALEAEKKNRADAETLRVNAETELEKAKQELITVEETEAAARQAQVQYIKAEKHAAEERKVAEEKAEASAFTIERAATAKKTAAVSEADATKTRADAEKEAALARAEGQEAEDMVAVNVHAADVEVLERELKAKQDNQEAAIGLEVELERIRQNAQVQIAFASSMGTMLGGAEMKFFGTPEMLASTMQGLTTAFGFNELVNGVVTGVDGEVKDLAVSGAKGLGGLLKSIISSFTGKSELTPEIIAEALAKPEVQALIASRVQDMVSEETEVDES